MKPIADIPRLVPPQQSETPAGITRAAEIAARDAERRKAQRESETADRIANPGAWIAECGVPPQVTRRIDPGFGAGMHPTAKGWTGDPWSLTILGPKGAGKTFLGVLVLARFAAPHPRGWSSSWRGLWVDFAEAFDTVRLEIGTDRDGRTLRSMLAADVLVIDDVGSDRGARAESSAFRLERLSMVLRHRYNHLLPTILTANLDTIASIVPGDERIEDRLAEGIEIHLEGPSLRPRRHR